MSYLTEVLYICTHMIRKSCLVVQEPSSFFVAAFVTASSSRLNAKHQISKDVVLLLCI